VAGQVGCLDTDTEGKMKWLLVAASLLAGFGTAGAQENTKAAEPCWTIVTPPASAATIAAFGIYGSILLNKCTGQSWTLVRTTVKGGNTSRWYPIGVSTEEAILQ
jgi:hypothetical protein